MPKNALIILVFLIGTLELPQKIENPPVRTSQVPPAGFGQPMPCKPTLQRLVNLASQLLLNHLLKNLKRLSAYQCNTIYEEGGC